MKNADTAFDLAILLAVAFVAYKMSKIDFSHVGAFVEKLYPTVNSLPTNETQNLIKSLTQ